MLPTSTPSQRIVQLPLGSPLWSQLAAARRLLNSTVALAVFVGLADPALGTPGEQIYQTRCASCHGANGGGVEDLYEGPLYGDQTVEQLTERITETMPEDDPEACVGEEAKQVANYIYGEFYSEQARRAKGLISAPRIELTRLSVNQHRNVVADLIGYFAQPWADFNEEGTPGLKGKYYQSKGMSKTDKQRFERVDSEIAFDFDEASPHEKIEPDQFAIVWKGNLRTEDTGWYEFRVSTQNGARLYVNPLTVRRAGKLRDDDSGEGEPALIDAWVSSGEMRSRDGNLFLLGGRRYSIRLEFFKYKDKTSSIRLEWKPPHQVWSLLDGDNLGTASFERTFVIDTPFPADDRSVGYERGTSISQEWHTAVTEAAIQAADEVINRLPTLADARRELKRGDEDKLRLKLKEFTRRFASVAYRRPLTEAENKVFGEDLFNATEDAELAVRQAVLLTALSPNFLYTNSQPAGQAPTSHTVASRLAFSLWDSLPDKALREAADNGDLITPAEVEAQAKRMVSDHRTKTKLRGFFEHWLELEERDLAKDKAMFPEFDEAIVSSLRESLVKFVDQVVWSEASDYRELLLSSQLLLDDRLLEIYHPPVETKSTVVTTAGFASFKFDPSQRSGILTHPYLLSAFAYHNNTSPIHRGVFLTRNIVGRPLKPPPIAVAFKESDFPADLTMREKITELTRDNACMSCHQAINPLGFALENYDPVGRWRTKDKDQPIDPRGNYVADDGQTHVFESARDIANYAVGSKSAHRAFIRQIFQHMVKQSPQAYGPELLDQLHRSFVANNFSVRELLVQIAVTTSQHDGSTHFVEN